MTPPGLTPPPQPQLHHRLLRSCSVWCERLQPAGKGSPSVGLGSRSTFDCRMGRGHVPSWDTLAALSFILSLSTGLSGTACAKVRHVEENGLCRVCTRWSPTGGSQGTAEAQVQAPRLPNHLVTCAGAAASSATVALQLDGSQVNASTAAAVQDHFMAAIKLADEIYDTTGQEEHSIAMLRAAFKLCPGCPLTQQGGARQHDGAVAALHSPRQELGGSRL